MRQKFNYFVFAVIAIIAFVTAVVFQRSDIGLLMTLQATIGFIAIQNEVFGIKQSNQYLYLLGWIVIHFVVWVSVGTPAFFAPEVFLVNCLILWGIKEKNRLPMTAVIGIIAIAEFSIMVQSAPFFAIFCLLQMMTLAVGMWIRPVLKKETATI